MFVARTPDEIISALTKKVKVKVGQIRMYNVIKYIEKDWHEWSENEQIIPFKITNIISGNHKVKLIGYNLYNERKIETNMVNSDRIVEILELAPSKILKKTSEKRVMDVERDMIIKYDWLPVPLPLPLPPPPTSLYEKYGIPDPEQYQHQQLPIPVPVPLKILDIINEYGKIRFTGLNLSDGVIYTYNLTDLLIIYECYLTKYFNSRSQNYT